MIDIDNISKGETTPLRYSPQARQRVVCGLNWDARMEAAGMMEKLKGMGGHNVETFDMDLACVMYDAAGKFVDGVSGRPEEMTDQSAHVYHSGDDTTGTGDLDDEAISVELKDMPDYIQHIIFVVEVQSKHTFETITDPRIRIADGKTDATQFEAPMLGDYTAFVFARLFRRDDQWMFHYIGDYYHGAEVADWVETLQKYVK